MKQSRNNNEKLCNDNAIDATAVEWVVKLDRLGADNTTRVELERWLAQDARHAGALLRAQAGWKCFDRLQILGGKNDNSAAFFEDETFSRRVMLRKVAAAGTAGLGLAAALAVGFFRIGRHQILTPVGEIRRVPLLDGSVVAVNTNSALNIDIKPDLREITLDKGEVWFDVAEDTKRPFIVNSGDVRIRALGTAFSVRRRDDGADVLVTEGVVETWTVGNEENRRKVDAGSKVFVSDIAGPSQVVAASAQIDRVLAWREGEIAIDGETLAEAAAEFNRYNDRKLTIDPALADERLVGWFHTNEPKTFAAAAATILKLKITETPDEIHLSPSDN